MKGYKHAYAAPEEEAAAMEKAKAFTAKLKEQGAKEWAQAEKKWYFSLLENTFWTKFKRILNIICNKAYME